MKRRKYYRYVLLDNRRIVYIGITDDPKRREQEHRREGKKFTKMKIIGPAVTRETAEKWEEERLRTYRRHHKGRNPKYNVKRK